MMTWARRSEILAHLYGRNDTKLTVLSGRWGTEADGTGLFNESLVGCWLAPGLHYRPEPGEMIITPPEALELAADRLIAWEKLRARAGSTAPGRDAWRRLGSPIPEVSHG
ncbi:hypothetical protein [Paramagnetospirillum magneticum]|uniref:Uncharacterized protein n=1 Tax=Paramagnetospirillum magneticum (strain ATCC 700264 / AMB-1) TaxID=342108 RepID=Q2W6H1_PARM1|nr:hypothetical protein [Paramagnetospirillum magneticum]BAE50554.1 hypothetical protein amb1750 [Paramagnetospirillum magneticum AMB-1]